MSVYDYKQTATLDDIEEILRFLPTILEEFYGTFGMAGGESFKYSTYTNMEDNEYAHIS